jgi:hypothetical protein
MRAMRPVAVAFALALLVVGATPVARAADGASRFGLRPGTRAEYRVHRDHQYTPQGATIDRVFSEGSLVREFVSGAGDAAGTVRVRETLALQPNLRGASREVTTIESRWRAGADALQLDARSVARMPEVVESFTPPLRWLPADAAPGSRWKVGVWRWDGAAYDLSGEALAVEDVRDGDRTWAQCLKVRFAGPITGTTPIHTGPTPIRTARYERVVWLHAEDGIVRERIDVQGEIEVPDGTAEVSEIQTRTLAAPTQ